MSRKFHGPRQATWHVRLNDSHASASYSNSTAAYSDVEYHAGNGRTCTVERTELCPVAGCDGHGTIAVRAARGLWKHKACPAHVDAVETVET